MSFNLSCIILSVSPLFSLACISHKISGQLERDVAINSSKNAREHFQIEKARVFLEQDGV